MTHTKKRILAMLLAVVLMFSALPFSVSADELPGELSTESTVESQLAELPAEETEESPPPAENAIILSDSSGDVPVLYAQDPFNTVKSEVEGGTNYMASVGVTRESIVRELEAHENDDFYLGTKYVGGDAQSPNGDASYNSGTVGMNCAGFISYVLRKAGLDAETTMEIMHRTPVNQYGSGLPYDWLAGASNYKNLIENGNISAYAFRTKQELLSSGLAEKGDIILMWWSNSPGADGADNHIGFFWGEASDDDVMWHSGTEPSSGNQISAITPKTPGSFYILIKIEPLQPKDYKVTLTKTSADVSITQGNSAYSLAGATYNVYKGTSGTGSVVATFTTDEAGHATLSTPLEDGTYSVKEVTPPKGYKLDEKIYTFTINGADTSLSVEDEPGTLTLKLKKKDSQTGSTPQGSSSLAGAVYQVSYQKGGQTVTEELTSDSSGNLGTLEGIPFGTVTVKELTAPEGYRLDTEVHTYTVDGSQLVGDTYTLEVDDLTEDVMRGGLSIQKLDSQTGTTPQGDASLEGISFEIVNNSTNPVVVNGNTAAPGQVAMTITTSSAGIATTGENALPYSGLTPGETYKVSGVLMDKATGEPLLVGEEQTQVTAEVEFTPEAAEGTVELTYTLDASALAGTTIVVFETLYSETFTTDGAGKIYIEDLAPGEYSITEQESDLTARYEIPTGQTVTVTAEEATTVEFYNRLLRGKITGHKTGAEQAPLEGVTFGLFDAEATEFAEETAIATTETASDGEFTFEAPYGNYQVAELETVPGYVTMKESIAVELDKTDVDLEDIANSQTVVHFSKVDAETGEVLPGAVLELYAPDGSLLVTWETSDIPHVIPGLPVGEGYILREVTAPEGFEVAEDVTFRVEDTTEIQTITMEDEKTPDQPEEPETPDEPDEPTPSVPQTGGSRAVIWVSGLLILALLGLCITVPLLRHINKQ